MENASAARIDPIVTELFDSSVFYSRTSAQAKLT